MSNPKLSPSEIYANHFQTTEPNFYTRVPNIIDHLTYTVIKDGEKQVHRLSVYAKELYRVIRMIASDYGKSWHTMDDLAEKIGCSKSKVSEAHQELLQPMDQLDGSPLIHIERKNKKITSDNGHQCGTVYFIRTIINIWPWNNAFMATIKYQNKYGRIVDDEEPSCSPCEPVSGSCSPCEPVHLGSCSPCERNNNTGKKNPVLEEQQPTEASASAHVCSSKTQKAKMFLSPEQSKAYDWMIEKRCNPNAALKIVKTYCSQEIQHASAYLMNQLTKNKSKGVQIPNIWGYFTSILKGRYWENVQQMQG